MFFITQYQETAKHNCNKWNCLYSVIYLNLFVIYLLINLTYMDLITSYELVWGSCTLQWSLSREWDQGLTLGSSKVKILKKSKREWPSAELEPIFLPIESNRSLTKSMASNTGPLCRQFVVISVEGTQQFMYIQIQGKWPIENISHLEVVDLDDTEMRRTKCGMFTFILNTDSRLGVARLSKISDSEIPRIWLYNVLRICSIWMNKKCKHGFFLLLVMFWTFLSWRFWMFLSHILPLLSGC